METPANRSAEGARCLHLARLSSEEQLASVVAYERVRFGGADPAEVLTDCGLAPAEGEEGEEGGAPGETTPGSTTPGEEAPANGETTTTVSVAEAAIARVP